MITYLCVAIVYKPLGLSVYMKGELRVRCFNQWDDDHVRVWEVLFAKGHVNKPEGYWTNVVRTDETKVERFDLNEKQCVTGS